MRSRRGIVLVLAAVIGAPAALRPQGAPAAGRGNVQVPRMPNLVGLPRDSALTVLKNLRLTGRVVTISSDAARGTVVHQSMDVGAPYERGQSVELTVSNGSAPPRREDGSRAPDSVDVPSLIGQSRVAAAISLGLAKLAVGTSARSRDPRHDGQVTAQQPLPGTRAPAHSPVNLTYGFGQRVKVPNLVDHSRADAATLLSSVGLVLGSVDSIPSAQGSGLVRRQLPGAASLVMESTAVDVTVDVSSLVPTPDVTKLPLPRARQVLESAGFVVGLVDSIEGGASADLVVHQTPAPHQMVPPRTRVHLQVSALSQVVHVPNLKDRLVPAAVGMLREAGLVLGRIDSTPRSGTAGRVITQSPIADAQVIRGTAVSVRISTGFHQTPAEVVDTPPPPSPLPPSAVVPPLIGRPRAEAESLIVRASLLVGSVRLEAGGKIDTVLTQDPPPGTAVDSGTLVSIQLGSPPSDSGLSVPDVTHKGDAVADSVLRAAGLRVTRVDTTASSGDAGRVVLQAPGAGTRVPRGTPVRIAVGTWVWPPWLKVLLTVLGVGILAAAIHRIWRKPAKNPEDEKLRKRMQFVVSHDAGHQDIPDAAAPTGSPALGLEVRSDPGTQIVEREEP